MRKQRLSSGHLLQSRSRLLLVSLVPRSYPEFVYRPQGVKQNIRLSRASSMVSELMPVVLLMRGHLKPGDTLIIEEPEAHLPLAAQTQMAKTLAALVRAGVRVVVTTHSDWLLQERANLVREGELRQVQGKTPSRMLRVHGWIARKWVSGCSRTVKTETGQQCRKFPLTELMAWSQKASRRGRDAVQ